MKADFIIFIFLFLSMVLFGCNNKHIEPNVLTGKWSGIFLDDTVGLLFSQQTVSINYHKGREVIVSKYKLNHDTLDIEKFGEKYQIIKLTNQSLSLGPFDTTVQESIDIIYEIKFNRE